METATDGNFYWTLVIGLLIYTAVTLFIFLIIRELVCWYWKINERITLLRSIDQRLASIENGLLIQEQSSNRSPRDERRKSRQPLSEEANCWFCGTRPAVADFRDRPICKSCLETEE